MHQRQTQRPPERRGGSLRYAAPQLGSLLPIQSANITGMTHQAEHRIGATLKELPGNRVIRLHNVTCVYCGEVLIDATITREHVIGRRFVPRGKLHNYWNLIVNACRTCNGKKSDLEDDISAITMQPDVFGRYGHVDEAVALDGQRKAERAFSRRTRKPVKNSHEEVTVKGSLGQGVNISFKFTGPPQADQDRVFELARLQLAGFFYWITFQQEQQRGYWWPGGFYPVLAAGRSDWGNPVHRAFAEIVVGWEPRVLACNADGFFKVALRRHPNADCWSWALEWNYAMRVIGFCGDGSAARAVVAGFPKLKAQTVLYEPGQALAYRIETPLAEGEDKLFYWDDGTD